MIGKFLKKKYVYRTNIHDALIITDCRLYSVEWKFSSQYWSLSGVDFALILSGKYPSWKEMLF